MTDEVWERLQVIHRVSGELADLGRLGATEVLRPGPPRRAMEREIEMIGEACRQIEDISPEFARRLEEQVPDVDWPGWRGLRNQVAHNVWRIDHAILWGAVVADGPALRSALERTFGPDIAGRAPEPHLEAVRAVEPQRHPRVPAIVMNENDRSALRFMHDVSGEVQQLAALGPRTVTQPGVPRRAAERGAELIGEVWIQLENRSPGLARQLPVDARRWRDVRRTVAKNLVHPDPHNLWRAVAEDAPRLRATLAGPDRHQRLQHGAPALSRRRGQAARFGGRALGD